MVLTKALVLKGVIGATSVVLPASLMVAYRKEISSYFSPSNLTKFDQGLIDYLDAGGDIQFKITKSDNSDLQASDLSLTSGSLNIISQIKITVNKDTDTSNVGTLTDASGNDSKEEGKTAYLQKINKKANKEEGEAWTWICKIQFIGTGETNSKIKDKDLIFKETNQGLFGILKSPLGDSNKDANKKIKQDFIKNCAKARGDNKNFEISSDQIETPEGKVKFEFIKETGEGAGTDLVPKEKEKFDKWFKSTTSGT